MRRLALLLSALAGLAAPAAATAHPLGNFTTNAAVRIEASGDRVNALYVLDLAEVPAFQARQAGFDARAQARRIADALDLRVDGRRETLRPVATRVTEPRGAGGLRTLRLEVSFRGPRLDREARIVLRDGSYPGRIGWREIVAVARRGASLSGATVPSRSASDELRRYPADLLKSPLDVRSASVVVRPGSAPGVAPSLDGSAPAAAPDHAGGDGGFAGLVDRSNSSPGLLLVTLLLALFWGAAHALSPGHGKAIVAAYLVGSRGTARQALLLGGIVTVTHTIGVFALGLITLGLSEYVLPEDLYPWLNLAAALLVVSVGLAVVRTRGREWLAARRGRAHAAHHHHGDGHVHVHHHHDHHDHDHDHGHHHHHGDAHGHGHSHVPEPGSGLRGLVGVGISGGLLPCPTALVVLLAAISLHRVGYGLVLIVAFSLGLAGTISAIGLVAVTARQRFSRMRLDGPLLRLLPAASAAVILGLGVAMTARALPGVL